MTLTIGYVVGRYPQLSQTFVSNEVDELRRQGCSVEVLSLHPGDESGMARLLGDVADDRAARLADAHIRTRWPRRYRQFRRTVERLSDEMGAASSQADWRRLPAAALWLRECGVSALHAHFAWNAAAAAWALSDLLDVPWSMTVHANDIFSRRRNLEAKLGAAARVVTVCDYNVRYLRRELGVVRPIDVVVCGVVMPEGPARAATVSVVGIGRLVEKKGFDTLVESVDQLRPSVPDVSVDIIGDGPLRSALHSRIQELRLDDHIRLVGALPHHEALERLASARVFALPCRIATDGDRDSMPVVIKEAMARAIPVVATEEVAVPEMVDATCGRLVQPGDAPALAAAIHELLDDPELGARLGAAGRERVRERFTLAGEVAKLRLVFEAMAS